MASMPTTAAPTLPEPTTDPTSTLRKTKRKLDDAFQTLDSAVGPAESQHPPPAKRPHTIRSIYSTLAKYGIKTTKESSPASASSASGDTMITPKKTPHLTAILARAAARTRKVLPFKFSVSPSLPSTADYRPSSLQAFLSRLSTFKLATYANKPPSIDAVAASKCGWVNDGKDRLVCGLCKSSWVVSGREGMNRDAGNALLEKQRMSLVSMHKDGCPWKTRQCDSTVYCIPLQSPSRMVNEIKTNALKLELLVHNVEIKHPLTSVQLSSLRSTLSTYVSPSHTDTDPAVSEQQDAFAPNSEILSDTAILTSLFGWSLAPLPETNRLTSLSRAGSLAPSTPRSPSLSRASSVQPPETPTQSRMPSSPFTFRMPSSSIASTKRDTLLHCTLCLRRVGLWAFAPQVPSAMTRPATPQRGPSVEEHVVHSTDAPASTAVQVVPLEKASSQRRQFDLLKEHRNYCPYVVRSTIVPTLPIPPTSNLNNTPSSSHIKHNNFTSWSTRQNGANSAMEGWRAVLTVVLRYGVGQRQRLGLDVVERLNKNAPLDSSDGPMEVDNIKAMVAGVKSRGGRDLLQYVKGLLG